MGADEVAFLRTEVAEMNSFPFQNAGIPLATLVACPQSPTAYYSITVIDSSGRLASRSAIRFMDWAASQMVDFAVGSGIVEVALGELSGQRITAQGHLRLSPSTRHMLGIADKDRLILAANKGAGILIVGTMAWLADAIRAMMDGREDVQQ
ncbi:hypothetical protein O7602_08950 [Micromonospora sp. WMMD1128]|uniref:hypothetical protein n=1 Tax=Micromonospora sp. WMMD1128 TaxID=3015150 RepID=UPI00248B7ED8|nr:hypothetical protein [Micromonospora sp. WMMD1128]WBB75612.1 hypothetical protein O7602_08950 [Micromonospora sp. WMMD1128]